MTAVWNAVVITGASRGFGRATAVAISKLLLQSPLHIILSGRNLTGLEETKRELLSARISLETICDTVVTDISDTTSFQSISTGLFEKPFPSKDRVYSKFLFINNAGSLGPLNYIGSGTDVGADMIQAFNINVAGCCYLTSEFVRRINAKEWLCEKFIVVNVSSLCAIQAFDSWGIYCAGKAARDMYHAVLAQEQVKKQENAATATAEKILVLNYAPGPLDTDMQKEIRECPTVHKETQEYFVGLKSRNELVSTEDSAMKLVKIVEKEKFTSGAHVDFFDVIEGLEDV